MCDETRPPAPETAVDVVRLFIRHVFFTLTPKTHADQVNVLLVCPKLYSWPVSWRVVSTMKRVAQHLRATIVQEPGTLLRANAKPQNDVSCKRSFAMLLCCSWGALYYWDIPTATGTLSAAMGSTYHMTLACRLSHDKLTQTLLRCNVIVICAQQWGVKTEYAPCGAPNVLVVEDLKPSSAYMFRLFECGEDGNFGEPRPEVTFHTQGVSSRAR